MQPLQLFPQSIAFFSSLCEAPAATEDENYLLTSKRCQFLAAVMNEDISIALEIAEEMKVSRDELLITVGSLSVRYCSNLSVRVSNICMAVEIWNKQRKSWNWVRFLCLLLAWRFLVKSA